MQATRQPGDKPIASPAVRRRAWDLGIELQFVPGSGTDGRITHEDLDAYAARAPGTQPASAGTRYAERNDEEAIPVIGLRRKIAQKMQEAKRRIPHFTYVEEIDVTELEALRARLNAQWGAERGRLTLLPLLARAIVLAVREFPQINARFDDEAGIVTRHGAVHIGIATQTDAGLMVPVLRHAEARDLWATATEIARLAEVARTASATREELSGSTITITSLGALGGIVTTPVINHPEVAIVGVNRIVERPMMRGGAVVPRLMMNLSSSFDHRVVDGMHGGRVRAGAARLAGMPGNLVRGVADGRAIDHPARHRRRPRRLCRGDPRRATRHRHHARRRRQARRHLPQHRLHSVQGPDPRRRSSSRRPAITRRTRRSASTSSRRASSSRRRCAGRTASSPGSPAASPAC